MGGSRPKGKREAGQGGGGDDQGEWSEGRVDVDLGLLRDLILRDGIEVSERLVHEGCHICRLLKDLSIRTIVNELQQLVEYLLNVLNLLEVRGYQTHLRDQLLFLGTKPLFEVILELLLLLIQLLL